jgi:peptidoglycan/LPS O-acetylase OafA/YrhL
MTWSPLKTRCEAWLARLPISALRDVVVKRPSDGPNLDVLDGVRGLAVVLVIASHTGAFHLKGQGALGVFLFFCLSAFLLTLQFQGKVPPPARLRRYVSRRVRRILPVYYGVIALSFLLADGAGFDYVWQHLLFVRADGIFWTIPQEMLFYALLPVLALAHPLLFRGNALASALAFGVIAALCHALLDESVFSLNGNGKQLRFHLGIFSTGMAFSYAYGSVAVQRFATRRGVEPVLGILGLVLLAGLFFTSKYWHLEVLNALPVIGPLFELIQPKMALYYKGTFGFLCGLLIFIALTCRTRLIHRILSSLTLRALGVTSYSLYLFHILVRDHVARFTGIGMGTELFVWTLAATYAVACTTYAFIERPFMRIRTRHST